MTHDTPEPVPTVELLVELWRLPTAPEPVYPPRPLPARRPGAALARLRRRRYAREIALAVALAGGGVAMILLEVAGRG